MISQVVQYFRKHLTAKEVQVQVGVVALMSSSKAKKVLREQRSQITTVHELSASRKKNPHKSANDIQIAVIGENGTKPSVDTVKRRLRYDELFGRISRRKRLKLKEFDRKCTLAIKAWRRFYYTRYVVLRSWAAAKNVQKNGHVSIWKNTKQYNDAVYR